MEHCRRHDAPFFELIEHPQDSMAPYLLSFREAAHGRIPGEEYGSLGLGEGEGVAIVNRDATLEGAEALRFCELLAGQGPDLKAEGEKALAPVVLDFFFVEGVGHDEAIRQRKNVLNQAGALQVDDDGRVGNEDVHRIARFRPGFPAGD